MKLGSNVYPGKLPSLEQGPTRYEIKRERDNRYNQCMQFMKVILYLELIVFIGWIGCIYLADVYQGHRYNKADGSYKVSGWEQSEESPSSLMDSNVVPVGGIELQSVGDSMNAVVEKSESSTASMIDKKDFFIETEITTTVTVIENDAQEMEDPINKWEDTPSNVDALRNRIATSTKKNQDEPEISEEKMTLMEDLNEASTTQSYFDTIHEHNNDLSDINIDDSLSPLLWPDPWWLSDYADGVTASEADLLPDNHFINWRFDFQFPDLLGHHLSRQAITSMEQDMDSTSSLSEETDWTSLEFKRSIESSSSEEKKTPGQKVKRSTDSSSSESDSSDSSSSDNNDTATEEKKKKTRTLKTTENEKNCPRILDDNGNTIDDPEDIVKHIKKNWFKWLLDTPVPDCDEPQSAKTVTVDECGKFVIRCTTDDSDETSEVTKEPAINHRHTRNVGTNDADWDQCEKTSNESRKNFDRFIMDLVIGEPSDPIVNQLRREFRKEIGSLIIQFFIDQVEGERNKTAQEWLNSLMEVRDDIYNYTNAEHQQVLDKIGQPTQEMADKLREVVTSVTSINRNCMNVLTNSDNPKLRSTAVKLLLERAKCPSKYFTKEGIEASLVADILGGEPTDITIIELRYKFKDMLRSLAREMSSLEPYDSLDIRSDPINITDEQWTTYMLDLKRELANATENLSVRQRLEASVAPTQEQTNQLRSIMDYYLRQTVRCSMLLIFGFVGSLKNVQQEGNRRRRSSNTEPLSTTCQSEENELQQFLQERQVRLENYNNDVAANETYRVSLLDTIDAQVKAENTSKIILTDYLTDYSSVLEFANHFIGNTTSSELWREGYELLRDVVIELQKLDENDTVWKNDDMIVAAQNFTSCLLHMSDNSTSEVIFLAAVRAGEALYLQYSGDDSDTECGDPNYTPVYGQFTYVGDKPERPFIHSWTHIFNAIIKLYFKIHDPEALHHGQCNLDQEKSVTEPSSVEKPSDVVGRSKHESIVPRIG